MKIREQIQGYQTGDFLVDVSGVLRYRDRACVPMEDTEIIEQILREAHYTPYTIHPGWTKMYKNLKAHF